MANFNRLSAFVCICTLAIGVSGCSLNFELINDPGQFNAEHLPSADQSTAPITGQYEVQIINRSGLMKQGQGFEGDIDGPITVQTVLERSGVTKKFRDMEITLYRSVQPNGQVLKLPVQYKSRSKTVTPEQDYAIHPGDKLTITSVSNNPLDKIVEVLGAE